MSAIVIYRNIYVKNYYELILLIIPFILFLLLFVFESITLVPSQFNRSILSFFLNKKWGKGKRKVKQISKEWKITWMGENIERALTSLGPLFLVLILLLDHKGMLWREVKGETKYLEMKKKITWVPLQCLAPMKK